jgi:hypothetical protein
VLAIGYARPARSGHCACVDRAAILAVTALALIVVGACGADDPAATSTTSVTTVSQDKDDGLILIPPYLGPVPTLESPPRPTDDDQQVDLIGTLTAPMPGCLVLKTGKGPWELTGGGLPDELAVGDEVEVYGQVAPQDEGRCDAPVVHVQKIAILRSVSRQAG